MSADPVAMSPSVVLGPERLTILAAVGDHLIPAAHGMPSAAAVVTEGQLRFVVHSRPDLLEPLRRALRSELGVDPVARLAALTEHDPEGLAALQLVIVAGYYTDATVRDLLGYPGQVAKPVNALDYPAYLDEGLLDRVIERGPIWRDPASDAAAGAG
jgi:hypothetical protein